LTVRLTQQAGSGQDGTATLRAVGDAATEVVIEISNPAAEIQPAHIHAGTCEQLDPNPAYALTSVDGGRSVTELSVSLGELRDAELVVNVHKSEAEIATYAACGALP
ncbi:MAG: hypothetical protein WD805_06340, partial [Gaiellaceae bacterium]